MKSIYKSPKLYTCLQALNFMKNTIFASLAALGALASAQAESIFWRNPDLLVGNFSDENAWVYQGTTDIGTPTAADNVRLGSDEGMETTFSGAVALRELRQYGGITYFTNDPNGDGNYTPSSFEASYRVYLEGGICNIYSYGDTPYTFTTSDAFILGDESSSYANGDLTLNIYGNAIVEDKHYGFCFGEAAQKYSVNVNVSGDASLKGKLLVGSKTLSESAKTVVTFAGNSTGQFSGIIMRENATLLVSENANLSNTSGDVCFYNEISSSDSKASVKFSDNGKLNASYKVYQYNSDLSLSGQSNISTTDYFLGSKTEDGSATISDTLTISDSASISAANNFSAYANSVLNISGTAANLSAKNVYLNSATINSSASDASASANVNVSENFYIYNSGALNLSKGAAKSNVLYLGYDGASESAATLSVADNAKFTSNRLYAYADSKILIDGANFEVAKQTKENGLVLNGANTLTLQNGATADLDRFAMYNEGAQIILKGSDLNVTAWCIGGDKVEDPDYATQAGTMAFVADASGISTLVSQYIDFNFDILLDFTKFAVEGESSFEILTITSTYFDMVANWVNDSENLVSVIKANENDSYELSLSDGGKTLNITYNHVVPEPAAYAAIFGALALAFAACRRRRQ